MLLPSNKHPGTHHDVPEEGSRSGVAAILQPKPPLSIEMREEGGRHVMLHGHCIMCGHCNCNMCGQSMKKLRLPGCTPDSSNVQET